MKLTDLMSEVFDATTASQTIGNLETQIAELKKGMSDIEASEKEKTDLKAKYEKLVRDKQISDAQIAAAKAKQGVQRIPITKATTPVQMTQTATRANNATQT